MYQKFRQDLDQSQQDLKQQLTILDGGEHAAQQEHRLRQHLINEKKARLSLLLREGRLSKTAYDELNVKLDQDLAKWPH
jgi:hypothetical protein